MSQTMQIDEEIALIVATQTSVVNRMKEIQGSIGNLATNIQQAKHYYQSKLNRQSMIIKGLQCSLRKIANDKKKMENELQNRDLAAMNGNKSEINELRKENKVLKAKNKLKSKKIRNYKFVLADAVDAKYSEDPDEDDGTPDVVSDAEVVMLDAETLLDESDDDSDPDDSEFEDPDIEDEDDEDFDPIEEVIRTCTTKQLLAAMDADEVGKKRVSEETDNEEMKEVEEDEVKDKDESIKLEADNNKNIE